MAMTLLELTVTSVGQSINLENTAVNVNIKMPMLQIKNGCIFFIEPILSGCGIFNNLMLAFNEVLFNHNALL
tara:strand:- start:922 stop:1137 length:216 start_codon:yes stop_codon:yes gene_type:complete